MTPAPSYPQPSFLAAPYRGSAHYRMCCLLSTLDSRRKGARVFDDQGFKRACRAEARQAIKHIRALLADGDGAAYEAFADYRDSGFRDPPTIP